MSVFSMKKDVLSRKIFSYIKHISKNIILKKIIHNSDKYHHHKVTVRGTEVR